MDDYTEPKDAKKFQWGDLRSPLSTNRYSDDEDEDDDRYSQPYHPVPGPGGGATWRQSPHLPPESDDIYEISPGQPTDRVPISSSDVLRSSQKSVASSDYDTPPARKGKLSSESAAPPPDDEYCHLRHNGTSHGIRGKSVSDYEDSEDSYSHVASWMAQRTAHQDNNTSNPPFTAVKNVPGTPTSTKNTSRQNSNSSLSGTSPVFKSPLTKTPSHEGPKTFTRQRVIYPRRSSSGSSSGLVPESEGSSQQTSGPAIYEEAWDTAQQKKRLEENLRLARSISTCSDTFEDALEYLPEDWAPARMRNSDRKTEGNLAGGRTMDPVTGGEYEQAWDLNRGLEEKLRSLNMAHSGSESSVSRGGGGGDSNYQEPWDLAQKQRELEERIRKAKMGGGRGNAQQQPPQQQQQQVSTTQQRGGEGELYEAPWDTKKGLAQIMQSSQSLEGQRGSPVTVGLPGSPRPSQSVSCTMGEPINAMIPLSNQEWYHGNISRDDAERILRVCKDGSYLVRDSSDRCHYTLSIKSAIQTIHIQIDQCQKGDGSMRYILGKNSKAFPTIPSMIDFYTQHVVPIKGADHMTLLYPVHCKYSGGEESTA